MFLFLMCLCLIIIEIEEVCIWFESEDVSLKYILDIFFEMYDVYDILILFYYMFFEVV